MTDSKFNCHSCTLNIKRELRDSKKGCNVPTKTPVAEYNSHFKYFRCPAALRDEGARQLVLQHRLYDLGVLPFEGGLYDQPAKYIETMHVIDGLKLEHFEDSKKKAEKQNSWQTKIKSQSSSRSKTAKR